METEPTVTGPVGLVHVTTSKCGSVINQLTTPLGIAAPVDPVTVVVKVVVVSKIGFADADTVIGGVTFDMLLVETMLEAAA